MRNIIKKISLCSSLFLFTTGFSVSNRPGTNSVTGQINFSATVIPTSQLTVNTIELNKGFMVAIVTYTSPDGEWQDEIFYYKTDKLLFEAGPGTFVAKRIPIKGKSQVYVATLVTSKTNKT